LSVNSTVAAALCRALQLSPILWRRVQRLRGAPARHSLLDCLRRYARARVWGASFFLPCDRPCRPAAARGPRTTSCPEQSGTRRCTLRIQPRRYTPHPSSRRVPSAQHSHSTVLQARSLNGKCATEVMRAQVWRTVPAATAAGCSASCTGVMMRDAQSRRSASAYDLAESRSLARVSSRRFEETVRVHTQTQTHRDTQTQTQTHTRCTHATRGAGGSRALGICRRSTASTSCRGNHLRGIPPRRGA
jgi:ribosomal protein S14